MDIIACAACSAACVASLHAWPRDFKFITTALRSGLGAAAADDRYVRRDSAGTIVRRLVSFSTVSCASAAFLAMRDRGESFLGTDKGVASELPLVARSIVSVLVLFMGPIVENGGHVIAWDFPEDAEDVLMFVRSICVAPIGEEILYRGVFFHLLRERSTPCQIVSAAACFAVSHAYQVVGQAVSFYREDYLLEQQRTEDEEKAIEGLCWSRSCKSMAVHVGLTFAFGLVSGLYYAKPCRRSLPSIIAVHALCNLMYAPLFRFAWDTSMKPLARIGSALLHIVGVVGWARVILV